MGARGEIPRHGRALVIGFGILAVGFGTPGRAAAQQLGIYASPDCSTNFACVPPGTPIVVHVMAYQLQQPSWSYGLGSAEFRFTGIPASWQAVATPAPGVFFAIGDPLGNGVTVGFFDPLPTAPCVALFDLTLTPDTASEAVIGLAAHIPPNNPNVPCANLYYPCNFPGPAETQCVVYGLCVELLPLQVHATPDCVIGVEPETWQTVKTLYR